MAKSKKKKLHEFIIIIIILMFLNRTDGPELARIFYSAIGNFVEAVPIFPVTFNVPDIVTAFGGLLSGMFNYITGNDSGGGSQPKDVFGAMLNIYRHIAVQEDIHDFEFMT